MSAFSFERQGSLSIYALVVRFAVIFYEIICFLGHEGVDMIQMSNINNIFEHNEMLVLDSRIFIYFLWLTRDMMHSFQHACSLSMFVFRYVLAAPEALYR